MLPHMTRSVHSLLWLNYCRGVSTMVTRAVVASIATTVLAIVSIVCNSNTVASATVAAIWSSMLLVKLLPTKPCDIRERQLLSECGTGSKKRNLSDILVGKHYHIVFVGKWRGWQLVWWGNWWGASWWVVNTGAVTGSVRKGMIIGSQENPEPTARRMTQTCFPSGSSSLDNWLPFGRLSSFCCRDREVQKRLASRIYCCLSFFHTLSFLLLLMLVLLLLVIQFSLPFRLLLLSLLTLLLWLLLLQLLLMLLLSLLDWYYFSC